MPGKTVEDKYRAATEHVYIAAYQLHHGEDAISVEARIDWIIARLEDARSYQGGQETCPNVDQVTLAIVFIFGVFVGLCIARLIQWRER
jgi:hypothetical protein